MKVSFSFEGNGKKILIGVAAAVVVIGIALYATRDKGVDVDKALAGFAREEKALHDRFFGRDKDNSSFFDVKPGGDVWTDCRRVILPHSYLNADGTFYNAEPGCMEIGVRAQAEFNKRFRDGKLHVGEDYNAYIAYQGEIRAKYAGIIKDWEAGLKKAPNK